MQYFIGIVPPKEIQDKILSFQKEFFDKIIVEPHITVKAQSGLTEDKAWLQNIKVKSDYIHNLHKNLLDIVNPSNELRQQYFENTTYTPHLTLGQTKWGISEQNMAMMKERAEKEFTSLDSFQVNFLRVYESSDDFWIKSVDLFFEGK